MRQGLRHDLAGFIRANLPLRPHPLVPEILLHTADERSGLHRLARNDPDFGSPYWARPWAGGAVLARHILDRPELARGLSALDVGTGGGIAATAAALAGARGVLAIDRDPYAALAAGLNAEANGVAIETRTAEADELVFDRIDLVLAGDVFYAPTATERVLPVLKRFAAAGATVLVGDPGRAFLPVADLDTVAAFEAHDVGTPAGSTTAARVLRLRG